jgi:predicted nucleic acid-binding protein
LATIVLDTTVLVDALRGDPAAEAWLAALTEMPTCSELVRVEFTRGLRAGERSFAERLCASLDWIPVTEPVARLAGELGRQYRRSHQGIAAGDLIVAATAQLIDAGVATHNVKHFPMFPDLRPPY